MRKLSVMLLTLLVLAMLTAAHAEPPTPEFVFDASTATITEYHGPGGDVIIPSEIDGLKVWNLKNIFYGYPASVTSVTLPDGMDLLDNNLLSQIPELVSVSLPDSLRVICRGNFQNCSALTEVTLPPGVSLISDNCFSWCENLTSITFTGICPVICDFTFQVLNEKCVVYVPDDQYDLYRAAIPEEIAVKPSGHNAVPVDFSTPADQFAFDPSTGTITGYRDRLARMDIPAEIDGVAVKAIGDSAFRPAYHLLYLTVPEGVEIIGDSAFAYTNSILYIGLPDTVREIGSEAFLGAVRGSRFHWPASLESIGDKAFNNCYFTDDLEFTPALKSIGAEAFSWAWPKNLILPEGCKPYIGSHAFDTAQLDYIQMDTYDFFEMAPDAFAGSHVKDVDLPWDSDWENRLAWQEWFSSQLEDCEVFINNPPDAEYIYGDYEYTKADDGFFYLTQYEGDQESPYLYYTIWDNSGEERVLTECHGLGDGVFKGNQAIRHFYVTHANWPQKIGTEAFADSSLETVDLFYTTESIGAGAFRNCKNLTEITLPASLTSIGEGIFDGCENLAKVTVLCDLSLLPENVFADCAALLADPSGLALPADTPDEIVAQMSAEMGCPWYAPLLRAGEKATELINMPFEATESSLFEFDADSGTILRYLGDEADVVVPGEIEGVTVTSIRQNAFSRCFDYTDSGMITNQTDWIHLRSVVLPETITAIEDSTFNYCQQLETFVCYAPVESTGRSTFSLCRNLRNVIFVNGVKSIGSNCFKLTGTIECFYNPVSLDEIGDGAFAGSAVHSFVVDAALLGSCPFESCESLTELHITSCVSQHNGSIAWKCPNLALLCFETDDLAPFSRDGILSGCAETLTVRLPEDADEETVEQAGKHSVTWSSQTTVTVEKTTCDRPNVVLPDIAAILAEYAANPVATPEPAVTPEPIVAQPVGEAGAPFVGVWKLAEISMSSVTYQASDIGMNVGFELKADGSAVMKNADGSTDEIVWTVEDGVALLDGVALTLTDDGRLTADQDGTQMIFVREGETPEPEPEPEPQPEPDLDYLDIKLNCVSVESSGYSVNPNSLGGEYSVTFHADGRLDFIIAGDILPNLYWTQDGSDRISDYYGQGELRFIPTGSGYKLDFLNTMLLTFAP